MKINVTILKMVLNGKFYCLPQNVHVKTLIHLIPLMNTKDAHGDDLIIRSAARGVSGNEGSKLSYESVIKTFGHHQSSYYLQTLYAAFGNLGLEQSSALVHINQWVTGFEMDEVIDDIQTAISNAEQDIKNGPDYLNLYMAVRESDKELLARLQAVFAKETFMDYVKK